MTHPAPHGGDPSSSDPPEPSAAGRTRGGRHHRRPPRALAWLGRGLAALVGLGLLWVGGVSPWARAALHLGVFGACALALSLPPSMLSRAGNLRPLTAAALPLAALAVGLVPLPLGLLRLVSPGRARATPDAAFGTVALAPERTIEEMSLVILVLGVVTAVVVWASGRRRRESDERGVLVLGTLLAVTPLVHLALDLDSVYGVFRARGPDPVELAPFVNPNQLGSTLLLVLPALLAGARHRLSESSTDPWGWWSLGAASTAAAACLATRSPAVLGLVGAQVAWIACWEDGRPPSRRWLLTLPPAAALASGLGYALAEPLWWETSVVTRVATWRSTLALIRDHGLLGVGGGNVLAALPPYQSFPGRVVHAHSDPLEWVAETGVVGAVALLVAAAAWIRVPARPTPWATGLSFGIGTLLVHSLVDFPLQMPGILIAAGAAWAVSREPSPRAVDHRATRALLATLAGLHLVGAAWEARTGVADDAESRLGSAVPGQAVDQAADRIARWAPWRPAWHVARAWHAEVGGQPGLAAEHARDAVATAPWDGTTLRLAALTLARAGELDEAAGLLARAAERAPQDPHVHELAARVARLRGDLDAELAAWRRALSIAPEASLPALIDQALARFPECTVWLEALSTAPAEGSIHLGQRCAATGDQHEALLAFEQAAMLEPWRFRWYPERAFALYAIGRTDEALAFAREATRSAINTAHAQRVLAELLEREGDHAGARDAYLAAAAKLPHLRGDAIREAARAEGAEAGIALYRTMLLQHLTTSSAHLAAARLYGEVGRTADCLGALDRVDPHEPGTRGKVEQARSGCRRPR